MKPLLIALQFLTRLPIRLGKAPKPADTAKALAWFPAAGFVVGLILLAFLQLQRLDPTRMHQEVWALMMVLLWVWLGDSIHVDGLADTLDGLASGKSGKAMLAVMHDSASGAFGVMGIGLALLGLGVIAYSIPGVSAWWLPLPLVASRLAQSLLAGTHKYAGGKGSLAGGFIKPAASGLLWIALAVALGAFVLLTLGALFIVGVAWWEPLLGLAACALGVGAGWLASRAPIKRLGGVTGDVIGYTSMITELVTGLLLVLALVR